MFDFLSNLLSKKVEIQISNTNQLSLPKEYITNIEIIDQQHNAFFTFVNCIQNYLEEKRKSNDLASIDFQKILNFIFNYINLHFKTEELIIKTYLSTNDLDYKVQISEHRLFVHKLKEKINEIKEESNNLVALEQITKITINWFIQHIWQNDVRLGKTLISKGYKEKDVNLPEELKSLTYKTHLLNYYSDFSK